MCAFPPTSCANRFPDISCHSGACQCMPPKDRKDWSGQLVLMPRRLTVFATLVLLRATTFGGRRYFLPLAYLFKNRKSFSAIDLIFLAQATWA